MLSAGPDSKVFIHFRRESVRASYASAYLQRRGQMVDASHYELGSNTEPSFWFN